MPDFAAYLLDWSPSKIRSRPDYRRLNKLGRKRVDSKLRRRESYRRPDLGFNASDRGIIRRTNRDIWRLLGQPYGW